MRGDAGEGCQVHIRSRVCRPCSCINSSMAINPYGASSTRIDLVAMVMEGR